MPATLIALGLAACSGSIQSAKLPRLDFPGPSKEERALAAAPLPAIPKQATGAELVVLTGKHRSQLAKTKRALVAAHKREDRTRAVLKAGAQ